MRYSVINIGPIVSTISAVRKPRELWSASYIFSFLMKCIIEVVEKYPDNYEIISPALDDYTGVKPDIPIGVYPDRLFIKYVSADGVCLSDMITAAKGIFSGKLGLEKSEVDDYFNLMLVTAEYDSDSEAILGLNQRADSLELYNRISKSESQDSITNLIKQEDRSPLFEAAGFKNGKFPIDTLAQIASKQLPMGGENYETEEDFYEGLLSKFGDKVKSYHKYICVVQADGDNMGKIVTSDALKNGDVKRISKALLEFGYQASRKIKDYGGLPIYAGGDDLLFIAPVRGCDSGNIFDLIKTIDECFGVVRDLVKSMEITCDENYIVPSMSYGISISYNKFPLYETFNIARRLLFGEAKDVKKHPQKNTIEWELTKHSGATFKGFISKSDESVYSGFLNLISQKQEEVLVSSVSHKIRENGKLIELWADDDKEEKDSRTDAFFNKIIDMESGTEYKESIRELMKDLYGKVAKKDLIQTMYGMVRTAKFINGEEIRQ